MIEHIVLEVLPPLAIGGVAYSLTKYFNFKSLDKSYSESTNLAIFMSIPVIVFLVYRLYFWICSGLSTKYLQSQSLAYIANVVSVAVAFGSLYFVPGFLEVVRSLYEATIGDIMTVIIENSREDFQKAYRFGIRILGLISVWFVVLFVLETVIALLLRIISWPFRRFSTKTNLAEATE
eukprot:gene3118-6128_t